MVRLLREKIATAVALIAGFQSHNGAIAAGKRRELDRRIQAGFNPTMVRLLLCKQNLGFVLRLAFQSHNGAIAALVAAA